MKDTTSHSSANSVHHHEEAAGAEQLLANWNAELLSFYSKRVQEYWLLPMQMFGCSSLDDLRDIQDGFCRTLRADYSAVAGKLVHLAAETQADAADSYAGALLKAQSDANAIIEQARAQAARIISDAEERSAAAGKPKASAAA